MFATAFSDSVQQKRAYVLYGALLLARQNNRKMKRLTAKWRLVTAVSKYAMNLVLAGVLRKWFDIVQILFWENGTSPLLFASRTHSVSSLF